MMLECNVVGVLAESSGNWEVLLLLLRCMRRLTLPERAVHDQIALRTLDEMPWVPHVHYWGSTCSEHAHVCGEEPWRVAPVAAPAGARPHRVL